MSYTAGDVMDTAASLLNDTARTLFSYTVQLPYLKMAQQTLEQSLIRNEIPLSLISEYTATVSAGDVSLSLPTSFFLPVSLMESAVGASAEDFSTMKEVANVKDLRIEQDSTLVYWDYRHNCINFVGATADRTVRLYYWRTLAEITSSGSNEPVKGANNYLSFKTAALVARYIMASGERADYLEAESMGSLDLLLDILTKNTQGVRVRRLPFRARNIR